MGISVWSLVGCFSDLAPTFWIATAYAVAMWVVALRWLPKAFEFMDQPAATAGWPALAVMSGILSLSWSVPFALARELANKNAGGQLLATSSLLDRKSVVEGKSVSVRVDLGGRRSIKKKNR